MKAKIYIPEAITIGSRLIASEPLAQSPVIDVVLLFRLQ